MRIHESVPRGRFAHSSAAGGPMRVVCFSTYVPNKAMQTPRHRDVRNFLLALRGEKLHGSSPIPVGSEERFLTRANADDSIDWFGEMVASYLASSSEKSPLALVPVPTLRSTVESTGAPWTMLLAISIASHGVEAEVVDALRWKKPMTPPSLRPASCSELYENLAVIRWLDPTVPVILVDYIFMSSATIRACARRLSDHSGKVTMAVAAGRTADRADHDAFSVVVGELSEFLPGH